MSRVLAMFRGAMRLEYRNQDIKLLRACSGEITRSSYRGMWIDPAALEVLEADPNPICHAVFVDEAGTLATPVRSLMVESHELDRDTGNLHFAFRVENFLRTGLDFDARLATWGARTSARPPERFVTVWQPDWPRVEEVPDHEAEDVWRGAIDFLTSHWNFGRTAFFRLSNPPSAVRDGGPELHLAHDRDVEVAITVYNPHLSTRQVADFAIQAEHSGVLMEVAPALQAMPRDGRSTVNVRCIEPGAAELRLAVMPDFQFSTYLPLRLDIQRDPANRSAAYRTLGPEWDDCLTELGSHLDHDRELHLSVLRLLERAFPAEPSLLFHRGRALYEMGRLAEAATLFGEALAIRETADVVAWDLFTALRNGAIDRVRNLLERLAGYLTRQDLFEGLVEVTRQLPSHVATDLVVMSRKLLSEDKVYRLVVAAAETVDNETSAFAVAAEMAEHDLQRALTFLIDQASTHAAWTRLREPIVEYAEALGNRDDVAEYLETYLSWRAAPAPEVLSRFRRFRHLLRAERQLEIAIDNSSQLFAAGGPSRLPAVELVLEAAELALRQGSLLLADNAIEKATGNLRADDPAPLIEHVDSIRERLLDSYDRLDLIRRGSDAYRARVYDRIRPFLADRVVAVIGERRHLPFLEEWDSRLRPRRLVPVALDDLSVLESLISADLVLIAARASRHQIPQLLIKRLRDAKALTIWSVSMPDDALDELSTHFPDVDLPSRRRHDERRFATVTASIDYAREHLVHVSLGRNVDRGVRTLDSGGAGPAVAVWEALEALEAYAQFKADAGFAGDFLAYCESAPSGASSVEPERVARHESRTVTQDTTLQRQRIFPVPAEVDPSGSVFMRDHVKLARTGSAPRLHFFDDTRGTTGKIHVGYIGPHLATSSDRT